MGAEFRNHEVAQPRETTRPSGNRRGLPGAAAGQFPHRGEQARTAIWPQHHGGLPSAARNWSHPQPHTPVSRIPQPSLPAFSWPSGPTGGPPLSGNSRTRPLARHRCDRQRVVPRQGHMTPEKPARVVQAADGAGKRRRPAHKCGPSAAARLWCRRRLTTYWPLPPAACSRASAPPVRCPARLDAPHPPSYSHIEIFSKRE
jgi:hypothetical protein